MRVPSTLTGPGAAASARTNAPLLSMQAGGPRSAPELPAACVSTTAAASVGVEPLLGPPELLLDRPLGDVLAGEGLRRRAAAAALGAEAISTHHVTAAGREIEVRVGPCAAPPAALISFVAS